MRSAPTSAANRRGIETRAHKIDSLTLEYATLVPMRCMNSGQRFRVVSIAAWCNWHGIGAGRDVFDALTRMIDRSDLSYRE